MADGHAFQPCLWQGFVVARFVRDHGRIDRFTAALMKEVSLLEMIGRSLAKVAAGAGVAAVLIWITYVMLDIGHMQSGFTLPQSSY